MSWEYSEKLKDPRWQKKRLEVFNRAGFKCETCERGDKTLHVHHLVYSGEPWDSPMEHLECLCWECHEWRENFNEFFGGKCLQPTRLCCTFVSMYSGFFSSKTEFPAVKNLGALNAMHRLALEKFRVKIESQKKVEQPQHEQP